jgi:hypothetical protein
MTTNISDQRLLRSRLSLVRSIGIEPVPRMHPQFLKLGVDAETEEKNCSRCAESHDCEYHGVTSKPVVVAGD